METEQCFFLCSTNAAVLAGEQERSVVHFVSSRVRTNGKLFLFTVRAVVQAPSLA